MEYIHLLQELQKHKYKEYMNEQRNTFAMINQ